MTFRSADHLETSKNDQEIDVAKIMERIRENIRKRKADPMCSENQAGAGAPIDIESDLKYINSSWQIQNNSYFISSHRPLIGKILIKLRELVHGEVRRYVDPLVARQNEFNACTVRLLNESMRRTDRLEKTFELSREAIEKSAEDVEEIRGDVEEKVRSVVKAMNGEIENRAWLAELLDRKIEDRLRTQPSTDINYFVFEERFRGSRDDIMSRERAFLEFFEGCSNVLDIGCGRGEFLELLQKKGIGAKGVDLEEDMVIYCRSRGLQVDKIDAISYLEGLEDKTLDGVFIDQVVEHLEPEYLIRMLRLCHQKLMYGHYLVAETVNPLSLTSFMNFFIDQSHKKPIHPETLRFLLGAAGFREINAIFYSPLPEDKRLRRIDSDVMGKDASSCLEVYNNNIDMLNSILYGPQDYAMIGKK